MRLLILGGTLFLGRHLAALALARGHHVTTFTRGRTAGLGDPRIDARYGDRDGDLRALEDGRWDATIDTSGYVPRVVRASAGLLADRTSHYTFVSSISVYARFDGPVHEDAPLATLDDPADEDVQSHYGALKGRCERVVQEVYGERALVVRPGLIVGPQDPTGRFTYWVMRLAAGGEVLAPGDPARPVQLVDVRDLAAWMLDLAERRAGGVFNATGPEPRLTMAGVLAATDAGAGARLTWVDDAFLLEHGAGEWQELPLWIADPATRGLLDADVSAAVAAGLRFRPLADTARDTLAWVRAGGPVTAPKPGMQLVRAGLAPEKEAAILAAWHARRAR